jgi:hypothetical protein
MHSHQGKYILYYINHQSINPLKSINHLTSINQTIGINDNMIQHVDEIIAIADSSSGCIFRPSNPPRRHIPQSLELPHF